MKKIVIAGAGAYHFAPAIFEDLFVVRRQPVEVWMVDSDIEMAELSARGAQALARAFGCIFCLFIIHRKRNNDIIN